MNGDFSDNLHYSGSEKTLFYNAEYKYWLFGINNDISFTECYKPGVVDPGCPEDFLVTMSCLTDGKWENDDDLA